MQKYQPGKPNHAAPFHALVIKAIMGIMCVLIVAGCFSAHYIVYWKIVNLFGPFHGLSIIGAIICTELVIFQFIGWKRDRIITVMLSKTFVYLSEKIAHKHGRDNKN